MARINIEDELQEDPRFHMLEESVGKIMALGIVAHAIKMAQFYWTKKDAPRSLIPKKFFLKNPEMQNLIDCELAVEKEEGLIYVRGSEEKFAWIEQKREAGKRGGIESGASRKAKNEAKRSEDEVVLEKNEAKRSGANPLTLTLTPVPALTPALISSTTTEGSDIPSDILQTIKTTMQYPDEIIEEIRKDAWIKYQASDKPDKNWKRFIANYVVYEKETIRNLAIDRGKVAKKPTQNNLARDMASKIYTQVLRNGMHGLKETLQSLTPVEVKALDKFGLASEIINCPSDYQAVEIKNRLKAACEQVLSEPGVANAG